MSVVPLGTSAAEELALILSKPTVMSDESQLASLPPSVLLSILRKLLLVYSSIFSSFVLPFEYISLVSFYFPNYSASVIISLWNLDLSSPHCLSSSLKLQIDLK